MHVVSLFLRGVLLYHLLLIDTPLYYTYVSGDVDTVDVSYLAALHFLEIPPELTKMENLAPLAGAVAFNPTAAIGFLFRHVSVPRATSLTRAYAGWQTYSTQQQEWLAPAAAGFVVGLLLCTVIPVVGPACFAMAVVFLRSMCEATGTTANGYTLATLRNIAMVLALVDVYTCYQAYRCTRRQAESAASAKHEKLQ